MKRTCPSGFLNALYWLPAKRGPVWRPGHKRVPTRWGPFLAFLLLCSCVLCLAASEEGQDTAVAIVIDALKGDDESMQSMAIALVREIPGTQVTEALARELPNLSVTSQVQLLSALADRGDPAALPAVIVATKAEDQSIRIAALKALGRLGDASSVALLVQTAAATSGAEQKAARESLYRLRGSKVDEAILGGVGQAEPATKVELIRSIAERNIYTGVETLLKTARDSDRRVRLESLKVLRVLADQQCLPALVELLINVPSESERKEAEKTVAAVARKIGDRNRQAEAVLAVLPSVKDLTIRCSLLSVLGKIGDDSALPSLYAALNGKEVKVQGAAIRALSDWPTAEPVSELLKAAQSSDNQIHRILALRGYVRLIGLDSERPAKESIKMYQQAMSLAPDAALKRRVLSGLANVKSFAALRMAADYLEDKALYSEAEIAVVKIAAAAHGSNPQQTRAVLQKVIQISKNDSLRQQAQEVINQIERFEDYLTAWQVCSPYTKDEADGSKLFEIAFAPEEPDAQDVTWRLMPAGTNNDKPWLMELDRVLGGDNRVAYLRNKVWSDKPQKVRLELGSDDGIKVWLNGQMVHANNVTRPADPGRDKVEVTLKQGWNQLLLKVTQNTGQWAVCARFRNLDGSKLEGLKVQAED